MKILQLHGSKIIVGAGTDSILQYLPDNAQVAVVSSASIAQWRDCIINNFPVIEIIDDEAHKTFASIEKITQELIRLNADRHTFLLGIGGGIVCDITGFVASVYMRGIRFGFLPTTLLAQVDAGVGGKNGVNFEGYKNILGTFNQPEFVLCCTSVLSTLPQHGFAAGFAEIVKAAIIADFDLFEFLEHNAIKALMRDNDIMEHIIFESIKIKADIVARDERECGERRKLNLGHTFAHAIEKKTAMPHGEAVSIGLCFASHVAQKMGMVQVSETLRIEALLQKFGLPVSSDIAIHELLPIMFHDKKKQGSDIYLVLPRGIGNCEVCKIKFDELRRILS